VEFRLLDSTLHIFLLMPPASAPRRIVRTRTNDVDDLSRKLTSKLVLSDQKSKQKASADQSPEDKRKDAMRTINSHSQAFTLLMQSGWKASENKRPSDGKQQSISSVKPQAIAVRSSLQLLRTLPAYDIDVERAASSFVGKLIILDLVSVIPLI
jgi:separase